MKTYIGTKIIQAEPQAKNYGPPETHGQPGYKVVYPDGYTSWSPAAAFDEAYRETDGGFSFGMALEALKKGRRVSRSGWNGKGMWLELVAADGYSVHDIPCVTAEGSHGMVRRLPWIGMKTADNGFVPWLASQTDVLVDDWVVID